MFVAFTGYARIATLGEEVAEPRTTIPKAIVTTLWLSAALYLSVAAVGISGVGAAGLARAAQTEVAPLQVAAQAIGGGSLAAVVTIGAITAMLSVLLNLILGLSRMVLAMGRRGDLPRSLAFISVTGTPAIAVAIVGLMIAALLIVGDVRVTWSFSAFTVLVYYAVTNLAALRLPAEERMFSSVFAWGGLAGCLFLAFWVEWRVWAFGSLLLGIGLLWHAVAQRLINDKRIQ
jgi:APA family basic amino acid/polyamine antiporter